MQAPETPVWLLAKNRESDALKSLCYLRGWTTAEHVKEEFDLLLEYSKDFKKCIICMNTDTKVEEKTCEHDRLNFFQRLVRNNNL